MSIPLTDLPPLPSSGLCVCVCVRVLHTYSGTSNKGPSEIGTTSLQRTLVAAPCSYFSVLFYLRDRDNLSTRDKTISPKVSLVRRFHCICVCMCAFVLCVPIPVGVIYVTYSSALSRPSLKHCVLPTLIQELPAEVFVVCYCKWTLKPLAYMGKVVINPHTTNRTPPKGGRHGLLKCLHFKSSPLAKYTNTAVWCLPQCSGL